MNWIALVIAITVGACGTSPSATPGEPRTPALGAATDQSRVIVLGDREAAVFTGVP